jgi:hypothetical protein
MNDPLALEVLRLRILVSLLAKAVGRHGHEHDKSQPMATHRHSFDLVAAEAERDLGESETPEAIVARLRVPEWKARLDEKGSPPTAAEAASRSTERKAAWPPSIRLALYPTGIGLAMEASDVGPAAIEVAEFVRTDEVYALAGGLDPRWVNYMGSGLAAFEDGKVLVLAWPSGAYQLNEAGKVLVSDRATPADLVHAMRAAEDALRIRKEGYTLEGFAKLDLSKLDEDDGSPPLTATEQGASRPVEWRAGKGLVYSDNGERAEREVDESGDRISIEQDPPVKSEWPDEAICREAERLAASLEPSDGDPGDSAPAASMIRRLLSMIAGGQMKLRAAEAHAGRGS